VHVTFWNWRRGSGAASATATATAALGTDLAPIELYTADARIVGWIAAEGRRVTDLMNEADRLRLWQPMPGPIDQPGSAEPASPDADPGEWEELLTERVILAMPPEWRASRQLRLHRKLRRVAMSVGPFSVTGNIHLPMGAEPGHDYLVRAPRFIPLTDAYLLHNAEPPFEHVVSVAIVNTAHVSQMVPLVTLA
jgi:hypothetical protein